MGFHVPDDLATTSLTLQQVRQIIANRKQRKVLQNRIDGLPDKRDKMLEELAALTKTEADVIEADTKAQ